jgi:hypothetical protein
LPVCAFNASRCAFSVPIYTVLPRHHDSAVVHRSILHWRVHWIRIRLQLLSGPRVQRPQISRRQGDETSRALKRSACTPSPSRIWEIERSISAVTCSRFLA